MYSDSILWLYGIWLYTGMRKDESCLHLLYLLKLHMMNSVVDLLLIVKGESYDSHMS